MDSEGGGKTGKSLFEQEEVHSRREEEKRKQNNQMYREMAGQFGVRVSGMGLGFEQRLAAVVEKYGVRDKKSWRHNLGRPQYAYRR